jgi:hypothetical protein
MTGQAMTRRFFDRGAVVAAYVGIGMAITMAISFLLVIPIGPAYVLMALPGGMIIGYYANARSARLRGAWRRILPNALLAGVVTGVTLAILLLATKALFFYADNGYNRVDANNAAITTPCTSGADCVYSRYRAAHPQELADAGITDAASFERVYWGEQWSTAQLLVGLATGAALFGGFLFAIAGPRRTPVLPHGATARA